MRRMMLLLLGAVVVAVVLVAVGSAGSVQARWAITDLGTLGGPWSQAIAVNTRGQVVGSADTTAKDAEGYPTWHAFLWEKGKVRDLGTLGGPSSGASAINTRGQVVGSADTTAKDAEGYSIAHAFLWEKGKMRDLGTLGGKESGAVAINDRGQVAGSSATRMRVALDSGRTCSGPDTAWCVTSSHAFLWQQGKMSDLGTLPFHTIGSRAAAISENAQIVGVSIWDSGGNGYDERPFRWQNGKMVDLGTRERATGALQHGSGPLTTVRSINDRGEIIGASQKTVGGAWHAILWQDRVPIDLAVLGRLKGQSETSAINDRGEIIGFSYSKTDDGGSPTDASSFVWQNGKLTVLGALPGGRNARAQAINERDRIVGWATTKDGKTHAVLWTLRGG